jgi:copper chaperone CopZ
MSKMQRFTRHAACATESDHSPPQRKTMMQTETLKVPGMNDQGAADAIQLALGALDGVTSVRASLAGQRVTVQFDASRNSRPALAAALAQAGFEVAAPASTGCCGGCGG